MSNQNANNTEKRVFTTGEAAKVCGVSQQTIIRCFDSGRLTGFRVPGSKFRRIPREELMRFMKANSMGLEVLNNDVAVKHVLLISSDPAATRLVESALKDDKRFSLSTAGTSFDAGILTESLSPGIVIFGPRRDDIDQVAICRRLRSRAQTAGTAILCLGGGGAGDDALRRAGANDFLIVPCAGELLIRRLVALHESAAQH